MTSFEIHYASQVDKPFWFSLDSEISESEFALKVRDRRACIICGGKRPAGILRYNLMYDFLPFLTLLHIEKPFQRKGLGRQAMMFWENEMRALGHKLVITSTQVNEEAQHFYRKLGYVEKGALFLDNTPLAQPQEMFMVKVLAENTANE